MSITNVINEKKKALLAYKEKILDDIKHTERSIDDFRANHKNKTCFYDDHADSSDSEDDFATAIDTGPSITQLKLQQAMMKTCLHATQELTGLMVLQSEVDVLVEEPKFEGERPVTEAGTWREVTVECRIDLVPFTMTFFMHTPDRRFAPPSYRGLRVVPVKSAHELELSKSVLHSLKLPSDAVEVLRSYAAGYRSRRTTLARLSNRYTNSLFMEPHAEGGFVLKCADLLDVSWRIENKWSPVAPFHHRMNFDLEFIEESYMKIITQAHKQLSDPAIQTDERTLLLAKIITTCLEVRGPIDPESDLESKTTERDNDLDKRDSESEKRDSEVMAPPKSLPKKGKQKNKDSIPNTAQKRSMDDEDGDSGAKKMKNDTTKSIVDANNTRKTKMNDVANEGGKKRKMSEVNKVANSKNVKEAGNFEDGNAKSTKVKEIDDKTANTKPKNMKESENNAKPKNFEDKTAKTKSKPKNIKESASTESKNTNAKSENNGKTKNVKEVEDEAANTKSKPKNIKESASTDSKNTNAKSENNGKTKNVKEVEDGATNTKSKPKNMKESASTDSKNNNAKSENSGKTKNVKDVEDEATNTKSKPKTMKESASTDSKNTNAKTKNKVTKEAGDNAVKETNAKPKTKVLKEPAKIDSNAKPKTKIDKETGKNLENYDSEKLTSNNTKEVQNKDSAVKNKVVKEPVNTDKVANKVNKAKKVITKEKKEANNPEGINQNENNVKTKNIEKKKLKIVANTKSKENIDANKDAGRPKSKITAETTNSVKNIETNVNKNDNKPKNTDATKVKNVANTKNVHQTNKNALVKNTNVAASTKNDDQAKKVPTKNKEKQPEVANNGSEKTIKEKPFNTNVKNDAQTVKKVTEKNATNIRNKDRISPITKATEKIVKDIPAPIKEHEQVINSNLITKKTNNKNIIKKPITHKIASHRNSLKPQNPPKVLRAGNTKTITTGNTEKENGGKGSKIPQKTLFTISEGSSKKNLLRISPRKIPSKFKTTSQETFKQKMVKSTNIPRLLKKPAPKT